MHKVPIFTFLKCKISLPLVTQALAGEERRRKGMFLSRLSLSSHMEFMSPLKQRSLERQKVANQGGAWEMRNPLRMQELNPLYSCAKEQIMK